LQILQEKAGFTPSINGNYARPEGAFRQNFLALVYLVLTYLGQYIEPALFISFISRKSKTMRTGRRKKT
jgi:hypothetical protein